MGRGDRLKLAANPPEPYADEEIIAMERTATGKHNLLIRLYRSTGCRLQEISHLRSKDVNIHTKTILIHEKSCKDCADCRAQGNKWKPKTTAGTREIPISDAMVAELLAIGKGLLFPDKDGKVESHAARAYPELSASFQRTPLRMKNGRKSSRSFKDGSDFLRTIAPYQQVTSSDASFLGSCAVGVPFSV